MSAAAGLSSARRRRAQGNNSSTNDIVSNTSSIQNNNSNQAQQRNGPQINALQILNMHEVKISQVIKKIEEMNNNINSLRTEIISISDESTESLNTSDGVVSNLLDRITVLEKKYEVENSVEDISFFKNKTKLLEEQLADVKRLLLKVQTFAMETNLSMMKVNKNVKSNNEVENEVDK